MFSQRFLFDTQGFVILRGVLSGPELAAARAAFERTLATATVPPPGGTRDPTTGPARSNIDGTPIREPDLERLVRQFHQQSNKISSGFRLELDVPRSTRDNTMGTDRDSVFVVLTRPPTPSCYRSSPS
eukprot:COSAG06_NODE_36195_length_450_cov_1.116809_1_plen_128_part_10